MKSMHPNQTVEEKVKCVTCKPEDYDCKHDHTENVGDADHNVEACTNVYCKKTNLKGGDKKKKNSDNY